MARPNWIARSVAGRAVAVLVTTSIAVAFTLTLVGNVSVIAGPELGGSVLYGLTIFAVLLAYGRERRTV